VSLPDWARAHGTPLFAACIRSTAEDFEVSEELAFEFSGDGEHDYLYLEKTGTNTEWLSRQLADYAGVPGRDVGYSGLKDRHAVTRQWFSVPCWNAPEWSRLEVDGVRILDQQRHHRKLRRGAHSANRFRIVLRGILPEVRTLNERLETIRTLGVPNYFGEQRFGRGGSNIALADAWSQGKRLPRHKRSLAISAARSYIFNQVLDSRVRDQTWDQLVAGDVANLDGSGSVFSVEGVDEDLAQRCELMDIHPTGPLCGDGTSPSVVPAGHEAWLKALTNARVKAAHRSLRMRVDDLQWSATDNSLVLRFALRRGAFATAMVREIAAVPGS
jgi:tRNA pseudouridine13 synthase